MLYQVRSHFEVHKDHKQTAEGVCCPLLIQTDSLLSVSTLFTMNWRWPIQYFDSLWTKQYPTQSHFEVHKGHMQSTEGVCCPLLIQKDSLAAVSTLFTMLCWWHVQYFDSLGTKQYPTQSHCEVHKGHQQPTDGVCRPFLLRINSLASVSTLFTMIWRWPVQYFDPRGYDVISGPESFWST
jgi:hypothetical protein